MCSGETQRWVSCIQALRLLIAVRACQQVLALGDACDLRQTSLRLSRSASCTPVRIRTAITKFGVGADWIDSQAGSSHTTFNPRLGLTRGLSWVVSS
jgi:hypothetical protein